MTTLEPSKLLSVKEMAEKYPFLTENHIRYLIQRDGDVMGNCIVRNHNRIYIHEDKFFYYLTTVSEKTELIRKKLKSERKDSTKR